MRFRPPDFLELIILLRQLNFFIAREELIYKYNANFLYKL